MRKIEQYVKIDFFGKIPIKELAQLDRDQIEALLAGIAKLLTIKDESVQQFPPEPKP